MWVGDKVKLDKFRTERRYRKEKYVNERKKSTNCITAEEKERQRKERKWVVKKGKLPQYQETFLS